MPVSFALFENNLTSDPDDYSAVVQPTGSADLDLIADRMVAQGSVLSKADILALTESLAQTVESLLLEGYRVNFAGLVELYPRISGVFHGAMAPFDSSKHRVDVGADAGVRLRDAVRQNASVARQETIRPMPSPLSFADLGSGDTNDSVTPGSIGTLSGSRLKFDPSHPDEGVFFVPVSNALPVKVLAVQRNKPSQLVFLTPALPAGAYHVEVRARIQGGADLRTGRLDAVLTV